MRRQCTDSPTADELFQDVWMNLIRSRVRCRVQAKFTDFLYRIAHNGLIDIHCSSAKHSMANTRVEIDEPVGSCADAATRMDTERRYQKLGRRILALSGKQHEAFLLHEERGFSVSRLRRSPECGMRAQKPGCDTRSASSGKAGWRNTREHQKRARNVPVREQ